MRADERDDHCKTVYAQFGLALYLGQVLEHGLVNALVFIDLLPSRAGNPVLRKQWEADFNTFLERNFETTLGKMIRSLKAVSQVPLDLESTLDLSRFLVAIQTVSRGSILSACCLA